MTQANGAENVLAEMRELRAQVEALVKVATAREQFINKVMNSLSEFAFPERELNGGDFVEQQGELYRDLIKTKGLEMDLAPKVMRLEDGTYRTRCMGIVDDIDEAGAFFGPQELDPGETLVDMETAMKEARSPRQRSRM